MDQTFRTLIHVGAKSEIDELAEIRHQLQKLLGKEFVHQSDTDYTSLNKVVAENVDIKIPEEGQVVKRLLELAQERNINYIPSHEASVSLNDYCTRKGIPVRSQQKLNDLVQNPITKKIPSAIPEYNPAGMPAPIQVPP